MQDSGGFRLLDLLEINAARVAYLVFEPHIFHRLGQQDIKIVQALVKEVGEAWIRYPKHPKMAWSKIMST